MKEYDVHLSIDCGYKKNIVHPILNDMWKYKIVKADDDNKAIEVACKLEEEKGNKVNYVLSCTEIKVIE